MTIYLIILNLIPRSVSGRRGEEKAAARVGRRTGAPRRIRSGARQGREGQEEGAAGGMDFGVCSRKLLLCSL